MGEPEATGRSVARIDLGALASNFEYARSLAGDREVIAVIKADAYGHGAPAVAHRLVRAGCRSFAVLDVHEGTELREAGIDVRILLLAGVLDRREAAQAAALGLTPVIHHDEARELVAEAAKEAGRRVPVHLEVDTGMRRMGVPATEARAAMVAIEAEEGLELEGVFSHFAQADESDLAPSLAQLEEFAAVLAEAAAEGIRPPMVHVDNSAGLLAGRDLARGLPVTTAVRPGLMLYGVCPGPHLDPEGVLQPVMSVTAPVVAMRDVPSGGTVGYGATFEAKSPTRVATLRFGYADGFAWVAANRSEVWLAGERRPVIGRVSMDYIGVEIGDAEVKVGDRALVFGAMPDPQRGQNAVLPVEDAARAAGTISYELLVRVGTRVVREICREGA